MRAKVVLPLATALALSLLGSSALARNANTTQQGSLLVFPKIDVREGTQTVINISQNGDLKGATSLKCYWQNGTKYYVDFIIEFTRSQPLWFDARTGDGTLYVPPFPIAVGPYGKGDRYQGELKCWVVRSDETTPIQYNHMSGEATIYNASAGTAYKYNAWRFKADANNDAWKWTGGGSGVPVTAPQPDGSWKMPLDGSALSSCPRYLLGQFQPEGIPFDGAVTVGPTEVSIASCKQDFRQDRVLTYTKLQFDIWNEQETKFTGAYECMNSWWSSELEDVDHAGSQFTYAALKTPAARYRVRGVPSSQCDVKDPVTGAYIIRTQNAGLVGVQTVELLFGDPTSVAPAAVDGEELSVAGTSETLGDYVWYDEEPATPSSLP